MNIDALVGMGSNYYISRARSPAFTSVWQSVVSRRINAPCMWSCLLVVALPFGNNGLQLECAQCASECVSGVPALLVSRCLVTLSRHSLLATVTVWMPAAVQTSMQWHAVNFCSMTSITTIKLNRIKNEMFLKFVLYVHLVRLPESSA